MFGLPVGSVSGKVSSGHWSYLVGCFRSALGLTAATAVCQELSGRLRRTSKRLLNVCFVRYRIGENRLGASTDGSTVVEVLSVTSSHITRGLYGVLGCPGPRVTGLAILLLLSWAYVGRPESDLPDCGSSFAVVSYSPFVDPSVDLEGKVDSGHVQPYNKDHCRGFKHDGNLFV